MRSRNRNRGFTLIELMLVVAIIGMIATIAIPQFRAFAQRSRQVEHAQVASNIRKSLVETWASKDQKFPDSLAGGGSELQADLNPPGAPGAGRQEFDPTVAGWNKINFAPEGKLQFQYRVSATDTAALSAIVVDVFSDMDQDGALRQYQYRWEKDPGSDKWMEPSSWSNPELVAGADTE